ncbi:MAG: acyltransferase family protein, partial [Erysipelotrichaceae bacterium]
MTINKKFLQLTGALLIIIFHLWIKLSSSFVESFLVSIAYIGVDIFFLVSVSSLVNRDINYKEFVTNRFRSLYPKFIAFILIMAIFNMSTKNIFNRLLFIEFFTKAGGSFLWFVPAILIFYIIFPLFIKWNNKYKTIYGFII